MVDSRLGLRVSIVSSLCYLRHSSRNNGGGSVRSRVLCPIVGRLQSGVCFLPSNDGFLDEPGEVVSDLLGERGVAYVPLGGEIGESQLPRDLEVAGLIDLEASLEPVGGDVLDPPHLSFGSMRRFSVTDVPLSVSALLNAERS